MWKNRGKFGILPMNERPEHGERGERAPEHPQPTARPQATAWARVAEMPWLLRNEIERLLVWPLAALGWWGSGVQVGRGWRCYGLPVLQRHRRSRVQIGQNCELRSHRRSNPLGPAHPVILSTRRAGAALIIGDGFGMTGGSIVCEQTITIGNRVWVGCNSVITDTDFHPLDPAYRQRQPLDGATAPVVIEDDVFVGMNTLILKGVRIGQGSVIGAGSVVARDIPPGVVAAGNPARVIRPL